MRIQMMCMAFWMSLVFVWSAEAESQDIPIYQSALKANQIEELLENHENLFMTYIDYREDGSIQKSYSVFINTDTFLYEDTDGVMEVQEPLSYSSGWSLMDYGEGQMVTVIEEEESLEIQQKKMEEAREYISFTINQDSFEVQKMEHYAPRIDGELVKKAELTVTYDLESYVDKAMLEGTVAKPEQVCQQFLNAFFHVSLSEVHAFFTDWENEAQEAAAEMMENESGDTAIISFESNVLAKLLETKFPMLSEGAVEKTTMNRQILWPYKESQRADSDMVLVSQTLAALEEGKRYRYDVELMLGTEVRKVSGTIGIQEMKDGYWVSEFSLEE